MRPVDRDSFDLLVVGGGHAGCEAALVAARLGVPTALITSNLDSLAQMPCNCSLGGPGKAHLVAEIVALGGEMGRNLDRTFTHVRMLNESKGPAVQGLRAQADKALYRSAMKQTCESQAGLTLWQDMVVEVVVDGRRVRAVRTASGLELPCRALILTAGTFLNGVVRMGDVEIPAGRAGEPPSLGLTDSLRALGLEFQRFKTGTVPRVLKSSLNLGQLRVQPSDWRPRRFHHSPVSRPARELLPCWITQTNERTHDLLRAHFHESALVSGKIAGTGPRYCPSLEAKLLRFPDRASHTAFLEQEGWDTEEVYVQGVSNSLPPAVQLKMLHSMAGLEQAVMIRPGYAIEYDCVDARQLDRYLRYPAVDGLFLAGQINGTSGYEEAAGQGLLAGINAGCALRGDEMLALGRHEAYLGVMIDDLVAKGTAEPYRMLTARAEHRLQLGVGSALRRLGPYAVSLGLLNAEILESEESAEELINAEIERLKRISLSAEEMRYNAEGIVGGRTMRTVADLLQQDEVEYSTVARAYPPPHEIPLGLHAELVARLRYEPYWQEEERRSTRADQLHQIRLPAEIDYTQLPLRQEAREALMRAQPVTLGQASALHGVNPADVAVLRARLGR